MKHFELYMKNIDVFAVDEQPIIQSKTTVFYVCLRITDYSQGAGRKQLSCSCIVTAWKWMGVLFFKHFQLVL